MVAEFWRGEVTLRQLRVLVEHLPEDSATVRAVRGDGWTATDHLLRIVANKVDALLVNFVKANGGRAELNPVPLPSAVVAEQERKSRSTTRALAYIEDYRKRRGA